MGLHAALVRRGQRNTSESAVGGIGKGMIDQKGNAVVASVARDRSCPMTGATEFTRFG